MSEDVVRNKKGVWLTGYKLSANVSFLIKSAVQLFTDTTESL